MLLVLLLIAMLPESEAHLAISLQSIQQLDELAAGKIETLKDARAYVGKAASLCVVGDSGPQGLELQSRLAAAELDAARDPDRRVSDSQVAQAFNFMSGEFGVRRSDPLTAEDILQYRSVQAALWPHLFSPKDVSGSRPISAVVILYQLWYSGGVTDDVRKAATLDRPPGSLRIDSSNGYLGLNRSPNLSALEYRRASVAYFQAAPAQKIRLFANSLARIIALPDRTR